jgi:hypothetical protein
MGEWSGRRATAPSRWVRTAAPWSPEYLMTDMVDSYQEKDNLTIATKMAHQWDGHTDF